MPREIDSVCLKDGEIFEGPDTGARVKVPDNIRDWPVSYNGHPLSHKVCPTHRDDAVAQLRQSAIAHIAEHGTDSTRMDKYFTEHPEEHAAYLERRAEDARREGK